MDFLPIFMKMIELFLIIIIGYAANKAGIFGTDAKASLSKLILNITMPCTILSAVLNSDSLPSLSEIGLLLLVSFSSYGVLFVIAKIFARLLGFSGRQKAVAEFGLMFANVGFIGYPVTQAIFGADSLFYTTLFNLPFNLLCYSLGVLFIQQGNLAESTASNIASASFQQDLASSSDSSQISSTEENWSAKKLRKLFCTPALIVSFIALLLSLIGFDGSKVQIIANTTDIVGSITTPGALLIIGSALADMPFKEMFTNLKAYALTFVSVIITPILIYFIYRPFTTSDPLLLGEAVIICGMPVATAGTMLCVEHDGDEKFMAQFTFLSTLLSVITIPILAAFLL